MLSQIAINNLEIQFADLGNGPALLLVHGFPLDHTMWKHQFEPLSRTHRVICPDLPGFGNSAPPPTNLPLRGMADQLVELLDRLEIPQVSFCGLSMGGYVGWQFVRYHADRLEKLIACDTRAGNDSEAVARGRRISAESYRREGLSSLADEMVPKLFADTTREEQPAEVAAIQQVIRATRPEVAAQAQLAMAAREDATGWLSHITHPTLVVCGADDRITPPAEMRRDAAKIAAAEFRLIPRAGHLSPLENPTDFNRAILDFLKR